jgi:hypothetical protein
MWICLSGTDGRPQIILYDYRPGRSGDYPIEFLTGFNGMLHCDGYSAYGRIEDVKFPTTKRKHRKVVGTCQFKVP